LRQEASVEERTALSLRLRMSARSAASSGLAQDRAQIFGAVQRGTNKS
jgi:hypothetical protein